MELNPVGAGVNEAAIGVGIDQTIAGADVAPAVAVVETGRGEFQQIDLVALHDVFHQRRTLDLRGWNSIARLHLARQQAHHFKLGFPRRNAEGQRGTFVVGESQADQAKSNWIVLDFIEQQHGPLIELRRRLDQRADLVVPIGAFDQTPLADFLGCFDEAAKIVIRECFHN